MPRPSELDNELFSRWEQANRGKPYSVETLNKVKGDEAKALDDEFPELEKLQHALAFAKDELERVSSLIKQNAIAANRQRNPRIRSEIIKEASSLINNRSNLENKISQLLKDIIKASRR